MLRQARLHPSLVSRRSESRRGPLAVVGLCSSCSFARCGPALRIDLPFFSLAVCLLFNLPASPGVLMLLCVATVRRGLWRDRCWLAHILDIFVLLSAGLLSKHASSSYASVCAFVLLEAACGNLRLSTTWPLHDFHVAEHPQRRLCEIVVGALCCYTLSRGLADQAVSPLNCSELSQALPALGFPCAHHQGLESCGCGALSTAARASWSGVSLSFHFAQCRWPVSTSPPSQAIC